MEDLGMDLELENVQQLEADTQQSGVTADDALPAEGKEGQPAAEPDRTSPAALLEGQKLSASIKAALAKINTGDASVDKTLRSAVFRYAEVQREFPGGLTEIRQMRDKMEEFGGVDHIEEMRGNLAEMDGLAGQYMKADPAFVEDLAVSSPESFAALAPVIFDKFAEVDPENFASAALDVFSNFYKIHPEGFKNYIGKIVFSDMQGAEIPAIMMQLGSAVKRGDSAEAGQLWDALNNYMGGWKSVALTAPAAPRFDKKQPAAAKEQAKPDTAAQEWQDARRSLYNEVGKAALRKALGGRTPSGDESAELSELINAKLKIRADRQFPDWQKKSQRYIDTRDKQGYLRFLRSIYDRILPSAVADSVARVLRPLPANAAAAVPGKKTPTTSPAAAAASGFAPVAKEPDRQEIDWDRTDVSLLRKNQAVLIGGKKVTWK